jgi:hypothetical protein
MSGRDPADLGAAIRAGLRVTTGAHLLVLRGDCRPAVNATRELHAIALASKAGLVSGVPGYAMPSLAERALVPGYPMTILGLRPLWVTLATRGRYRWLAYANPALLLIERAATVDDSKGPDATDEQVAGRPGTVTTDAADPGDGPGPQPPAGLPRTRTAIDIARWVVDRGGRVRLVDALDLAASRPHPDGDGGLQAWRRSSLLVADRSFGRLLAWMLATGAAWLLPTVAPMVGLALDRPDLVLGGLVALAAVATFRIVLALLERQPLGVVVFHPATTIGLLAAQTAGLADAVLGRAIAPPTDGPGGEAE